MKFKSLIIAAVSLSPFAALAADPQIVSTFDTDDEGWVIMDICQQSQVPSPSPTPKAFYSPTNGNAGGYIWQRDNHPTACGTNGPAWWFFQAPSKFLGNRSNFYGGSLSFDIRRHIGTLNNFHDVFIEGSGITLVIDARPGPVIEDAWTEYSVPLRTSASWHKGTSAGAQPTSSEFEAVLEDLTAIRIRGEYNRGSDIGDLDNVLLSAERASLPHSTIDNQAVHICWDSKVGESYQVQFKSELTTNTWVDFGSSVPGNGGTNCVFDVIASPERFYQVIVLP